MSQKSGFFYVKRLPKKIHHFLFSIVFLLLGTTVADAAGYTCSNRRYTSCAAGYYLNGTSAGNSCSACSGVSNSSSTQSGTEGCTYDCTSSIANAASATYSGTRSYTNRCAGYYTGGGCYSAGATCTGCSKWERISTGSCGSGSCNLNTCNSGYTKSGNACNCTTNCTSVSNRTSTQSGTETCTRSCYVTGGTCYYSGSTRTYTNTCNDTIDDNKNITCRNHFYLIKY